MKFNLDSFTSKIKYPEKKLEKLSEDKEKENYAFNATESKSDYNKIQRIEDEGPVHKENKYNSVSQEEGIADEESSYVTAEDIVDEEQTEDRIISLIDERIKKERAEARTLNDYGFFDVIEKLLNTANKKNNLNEVENILNRTQEFIASCQEVLTKNLPEAQEEKEIENIFNNSFGKIAYSGPDAELVNELMMVVKKAPKNKWRGERVSQNGKQNLKLNKDKNSRHEPERKIKINW